MPRKKHHTHLPLEHGLARQEPARRVHGRVHGEKGEGRNERAAAGSVRLGVDGPVGPARHLHNVVGRALVKGIPQAQGELLMPGRLLGLQAGDALREPIETLGIHVTAPERVAEALDRLKAWEAPDGCVHAKARRPLNERVAAVPHVRLGQHCRLLALIRAGRRQQPGVHEPELADAVKAHQVLGLSRLWLWLQC